jgi:hypothetical protein
MLGRCECCREIYNIPDLKTIEKTHRNFQEIYKWFKLFMIYVFIPIHFFVVAFLNPSIFFFDKLIFGIIQTIENLYYEYICCYLFSYVLVIAFFGFIFHYILYDLHLKIAKEKLKKIVVDNRASNLIPTIFLYRQ